MAKQRLNTKLDAATVALLKIDIYSGMTQDAVAKKYGIQQPSVSRIVHGVYWASVPWPDGATGRADIEKVRMRRNPMLDRPLDVAPYMPSKPGITVDQLEGAMPDETMAKNKKVVGDGPVRDVSSESISASNTANLDTVLKRETRTRDINTFELGQGLEAISDELSEIDDTEMHNAMFTVGESPEVEKLTPKSTLADQPRIKWKDVEAAIGKHPVVLKAKLQKQFRLPLQVALYRLEKSTWATVNLKQITEDVATMFDYDLTRQNLA